MQRGEEHKSLEETPRLEKKWDKKTKQLAIVFPNLYYGGVYSLAPLIIYNIVNQMEGWSCSRRFLDYSNLEGFNLMGFTFQYELDYYNFFKILEKNNISKSKERDEIIFAGGPSVSSNSKPLEPYVDFFFFGDCEESVQEVLKAYDTLKEFSKEDFLKEIADIKGVYVPGLSKEKTVSNVKLEDYPYPIIQPLPEKLGKEFVFGSAFLLELERGCPYRCHFCVIPRAAGGFKYRPAKQIMEIIEEGLRINDREKVVIYSPSFVHPERRTILKYLVEKKIPFSIPSVRAELIDEEILDYIKQGGQTSLTFAPESSERLREATGKLVKDEIFFTVLRQASEKGFKKIKLYFIIGLDDEKKEDILDVIQFIKECNRVFKGLLYVSFNTFVPKKFNAKEKPGKKDLQEKKKEIEEKKQLIKKSLEQEKKRMQIKFTSISLSLKEWELSLSDSLDQ